MKVKTNGLLQILALLLIFSTFLFSKELIQHKKLLKKSNLDRILNKNIWTGSYLDKRDNYLQGEISHVEYLFIFFKEKK